MELPFSAEQFFGVFRQYNEAVWLLQVGLNLLGVIAVALWIWRRPAFDRLIAAILALLWAWTGIAYHLAFFTAINKAAYLFGAVYLAGAGAFLWAGTLKAQMRFASDNTVHRVVGVVLLVRARRAAASPG